MDSGILYRFCLLSEKVDDTPSSALSRVCSSSLRRHPRRLESRASSTFVQLGYFYHERFIHDTSIHRTRERAGCDGKVILRPIDQLSIQSCKRKFRDVIQGIDLIEKLKVTGIS